jgi:hypothetical protein
MWGYAHALWAFRVWAIEHAVKRDAHGSSASYHADQGMLKGMKIVFRDESSSPLTNPRSKADEVPIGQIGGGKTYLYLTRVALIPEQAILIARLIVSFSLILSNERSNKLLGC